MLHFFFPNPDEEPILKPAARAARDSNLLFGLSIILFIVGSVIAGMCAGTGWVGALLICLAFFGVALLLGFLFGIPKSGTHVEPADEGAKRNGTALAVNTNLEQISDWLTKIIIGIGLVELKQLPGYVDQLIIYVAPLLGKTSDDKALCANIFMYFGSLGFLNGYLSTRIFLSRLIGYADLETNRQLPEADKVELGIGFSAPTVSVDNTKPPQASASVDRAASRIIEAAPLVRLTKLDDILAWAQSQLALGHFADAAKGYLKAVDVDPSDIRAHLGLGVVYYYSMPSEPVQKALSELLAAQSLITNDTDPSIRAAIYENLAAAYLYTEPPGGYQMTLEYANRALELRAGANAHLYFYLAAARGQQYRWRTGSDRSRGDANEARAEMLWAARAAIASDSSMVDRLWDLAKDPEGLENDLAVFANDPEFLALVGRAEAQENN